LNDDGNLPLHGQYPLSLYYFAYAHNLAGNSFDSLAKSKTKHKKYVLF
jgi:hypothetical protein